MKIKITFLLLFLCVKIFAQQDILDKTIELQQSNYKLSELIIFIEGKYDVKFAFDAQILFSNKSCEFQELSMDLQSLLSKVCAEFNLSYKLLNGQIILTQNSKTKKVSLSGYIWDSKTGESLPGATIYLAESNLGTSSNNYGFYSLTVPEGKYDILFTFVGYSPKKVEVELHQNEFISVKIDELNAEIEEVKVVGERDDSKTHQFEAGKVKLTMKDISALPAYLGEVDVLKGFQHLPGVQSVNDGISLLSVRGGSFDQNLIILDEAPVYNPTHVLGFFSVFNPDAVSQAEMYKGFIPAKYGGRISSVIDIQMKEGNRKKLTAIANVNLYASRLTVESPIFNENTSVLIAGRYAYTSFVPNAGKELSNVIYMYEYNSYPTETKINFWDVNMKLNHRINAKNHVYFSSYLGNDYFFYPLIDKKSSIEWGNSTATLRWNHIYNSKLFSNSSLVYSNYNYSYLFFDNGYSYNWEAGMREYDTKADFEWYVNAVNKFGFGFSVNNHTFQPGKIQPTDTASSVIGFELEKKRALEPSIYLNHNFRLNHFSIESGLRLSSFITQYERVGEEIGKPYMNLEPRLAVNYRLSQNQSLKTSYSRTTQYMHLLRNASIGFPTNIWVPADAHIKPQYSDQVSLGHFSDLFKKSFEFSAEVYYKKMYDIIDFIDNANLFLNENIETEIRKGSGESCGLEIMLSKTKGVLKGNVSYTLSETKKTIEGINNNMSFPASTDIRHTANANVNIELGKRWVAMTSFTFKSGAPITMVKGYYFYENIPFAYYSERNGYRLPAYHSLDIALVKKSKQKEGRKWVSEFTFGVNNAYNRINTFAVFFDKGLNVSGYGNMKQLYLFGRMPFVSCSVWF